MDRPEGLPTADSPVPLGANDGAVPGRGRFRRAARCLAVDRSNRFRRPLLTRDDGGGSLPQVPIEPADRCRCVVRSARGLAGEERAMPAPGDGQQLDRHPCLLELPG